MKVGILGSGDVGRALGKGFAARGHDVKLGSRNTKSKELLAWLKDTTNELPLRIAAARMARVGTGLVDAEVTLAPAGQK